MGGFFGCVSSRDCVNDLFYGVDYHSHLGTRRAGMAVVGPDGFHRRIHDISNAHFRSKFEDELPGYSGRAGIGVISDLEDQPILSTSHLGTYAIVTVSCITNMKELTDALFSVRRGHLAQTTGLGINATEMISALIDTQETFEAGLQYVQEVVRGSCSLLILTEQGQIYAMRDRYGRTPVILGRNADGFAVAMETTAFPNLGYETFRDLGPGEITLLSADHEEIRALPRPDMRICAFFWIYYGFPSSSYEGVNVEDARYRGGQALAERSGVDADLVAGVPDSGVGNALGYSHRTGLPYKRPFVKYTPTWPRSFMPTDQSRRQLIANKKLLTIPELIRGKRLVCCDDSIVRGTQMRDQAKRLYDNGASEVHMRISCPPLLFGCKFLNFSRTNSEDELIARRTAKEIDGENADLRAFIDPEGPKYKAMVDRIRLRLGLTSLAFQHLDDMIRAIGLPKDRICTYCWNGEDISCPHGCASCPAAHGGCKS